MSWEEFAFWVLMIAFSVKNYIKIRSICRELRGERGEK